MCGEQVRAVQRQSGADARIVGTELLAEVDALLAIGHARRQLSAEREPTAPRPPAVRHRDGRLLVVRSREELARQPVDALDEAGRHVVPDHVEEPGLATRDVDRGRHRVAIGIAPLQRGHVDDRDRGHE